MTPSGQSVAVIIFAESQQREARRKGLGFRLPSLLSISKLYKTAVNADLHWFCDRQVKRNAAPAEVLVHLQRGNNFAQRLENAVEAIAAKGYERIVIVGQDCPQLSSDDINHAIELLDHRQLVIGPDHRGGCWLIAIHSRDRARLRGIVWQKNTDARQLQSRFAPFSVEVLETKLDIDHNRDVLLLSRIFDIGAAVLAPDPLSRRALIPNTPFSFVRMHAQIPPPRHFLAA